MQLCNYAAKLAIMAHLYKKLHIMFDNYAQHVQLFSFDNYKYSKIFDANPYYR